MDLRSLLSTNLSGLFFGSNYDQSQPNKDRNWKGPIYRRRRHKYVDVLFVMEQLQGLVRANAPLVGGLTDALSLDAPNGKVEAILLTLRDDIEAGLDLADAMRLRPRFFLGHYCDLIAAGESTGTLDQAFQHVTEDLDRELELGGTWGAYIAYVFLLVSFQLWILVFISMKVAPVFDELLSDFGVKPNGSLNFLVGAGDWLSLNYRGVFITIFCIAILATISYFTGALGVLRSALGFIAIRLPVARWFLLRRQLSTVAHVLARLVEANVPLVDALQRVDAMAIDARLRDCFRRVRDQLLEGSSFRDALMTERRLLPRSFIGWIALGEESATLADSLDSLSAYYHQQWLKARVLTARMIAPLGIVLAGGLAFLGTSATILLTAQISDAMLASM